MIPVPLIRTAALTKHYPGVVALDAVDLSVESGIVGLVGPNGAGKSTLIKILLGLLTPTSGAATVLGFDAGRESLRVRELVGYAPEHECLPADLSAVDFVVHMARMSGLPAAVARERGDAALRYVGLAEERYRRMHGYSTGMKQRVKLAQALAHDPKLLLLDEPANGLDPEGREEMLALIERIGHEFGISIVMSSHLLSEIERVCDSLIVIEQGKLVRAGRSPTSRASRICWWWRWTGPPPRSRAGWRRLTSRRRRQAACWRSRSIRRKQPSSTTRSSQR